MLGRIRLHDYRCFRRERPATLEIHRGFTSFVGPNNAGKSTLIRILYELRTALDQLRAIAQSPGRLVQGGVGWALLPPLNEHAEIVCERSAPRCSVDFEPRLSDDEKLRCVARATLEFTPNGAAFRCRIFDSNGTELGVPNSHTAILGQDGSNVVLQGGTRYSVQPLVRFLDCLMRAQYFGPFRNAINEGAGGHFDIQIGTGFISQWNLWKTGANREQNRAIERVTEDVRRLIGARTLEITAASELRTLQVVVDRRPHKLQELGAGFSQLVVVLANALVRQPSLIMIDEPELHLHPGLQSEFLTTLGEYAQDGVLFATHSIGLARLADRSFTVGRVDEAPIVRPFERSSHYAEFLGSLGIAALQELGWDRILLVEGPKDVRTFQHLLRLYDKEHKTVVLPLGGDSMINGGIGHELAEVVRLGGKVAAVVDSERGAAEEEPIKARRDFSQVCKSLGVACCVTQRRAIENYLSERALNEAFSGRYAALGHFDEPTDSFWGKGENWRAASLMTRAELDETDVGRFLATL